MPDTALPAVSHLFRWVNLWLALMSIIKEIGKLRFSQFLQFLLVIPGGLLNTFIKLVLGRMGDLSLFKLVRFGPVRGKNAFSVDRFPDF
jgi:hypothetical protein